MFSRQHYKKIAEVIKHWNSDITNKTPLELITLLEEMFKQDNPRFKYEKFEDYINKV